MNRSAIAYRYLRIIIALALVLLCSTCLEPFPLPDVSTGFLVIEGTFTDSPDENSIKLSFAGMVNEKGSPVTGAKVFVSDDLGNTGTFLENEGGLYLPSSNDFFGIEGRKYVLQIELRDGRVYHSDSTSFRGAPPIDELSWELQQAPSPDNTEWLIGVEFYIQTHDPENLVRNFIWKYDEIWEIRIPYPIRDIYLGQDNFQADNHTSRCYLSNQSTGIMMGSTSGQSQSIISDHPVVFISNETARLKRKYRINVKQYSPSDEAYKYHEKLLEITGQNGTIFDEQPFTLRGNVRNVDDPAEIVMGYFLVSGVSTKSITLSGGELPFEYRGTDQFAIYCNSRSRDYGVNQNTNFVQLFNRFLPRWGLTFVGIIWEVNEMTLEEEMVGLQFAPEECTECQGTLEKPDDWDY